MPGYIELRIRNRFPKSKEEKQFFLFSLFLLLPPPDDGGPTYGLEPGSYRLVSGLTCTMALFGLQALLRKVKASSLLVRRG